MQRKRAAKLTSNEWVMIRVLAEAKLGTFKELGRRFGIAEVTIKHRSSVENWKLGALAGDVDRIAQEKTVDTLARLGMPKERLLKLMVEGAVETKSLKNVKQVAKDKQGNVLQKFGIPVVIEQTIEVVDNSTRLEYRKELAKMMPDTYAPPRVPVKGDGSEAPVTASEIHYHVQNEESKAGIDQVLSGDFRELDGTDESTTPNIH